jgi:hypothetical protein
MAVRNGSTIEASSVMGQSTALVHRDDGDNGTG